MPKVTLDLETLTLGELMEAETQSGIDAQKLLGSNVSRMTLAVFVQQWRSSGSVPSWKEVAGLRLLDALGSTSRSSEASTERT